MRTKTAFTFILLSTVSDTVQTISSRVASKTTSG